MSEHEWIKASGAFTHPSFVWFWLRGALGIIDIRWFEGDRQTGLHGAG